MIANTENNLRPRIRRAFSLVEILLCVLIIGVISSLVLINVGAADASTRLDSAAQAIIGAFRYARIQSMSHGQTSGSGFQPTDAYGVSVNTAANTITVYHATWNAGTNTWSLPGTPVANSLFGGGTYVINLSTYPPCAGVQISAVNLTGTADTSPNTASPYYCQYRPCGDTFNYGTGTVALTLSYGGKTCSIMIPEVGDAQEN